MFSPPLFYPARPIEAFESMEKLTKLSEEDVIEGFRGKNVEETNFFLKLDTAIKKVTRTLFFVVGGWGFLKETERCEIIHSRFV